MENYSAKSGVDGKPETGADGKLIKGDLAKVFVMEKGEGWGKGAPKELANGDWIYTAFSPDGKVLNEDYQKCRTCHIPLAQNDFIHRYDEYFNHK
jgi:hemoglobin